jgi:hypothetical protein
MSTAPVLDYQPPTSIRWRLAWLGWAVYLAMSWTWCIGMFLPALLVRDYGVWGWVVFAVPNVLGAAAVGWLLGRDDSRNIVQRHRVAVHAFSVITIAFQLFFLVWILSWPPQAYALALGAAAVLVVLISLRGIGVRVLAAAVFATSLICAWLAQLEFQDGIKDFAQLLGRIIVGREHVATADSRLIPLAIVCLFGFALCPYLDATFHAARQTLSDRESRQAFSIGFGIFFFSMILFALQYAIESIWRWHGWGWLSTGWASTHLTVQMAFTVGVHISADRTRWLRTGIAAGVLALVATAARQVADEETIYRLFMSFYALVFPAYVWLCVIPGRGRLAPTTRQWTVFTEAVCIAAPMFWLGFFEGRMIWLLPGIAVVLLARLLIPNMRRA